MSRCGPTRFAPATWSSSFWTWGQGDAAFVRFPNGKTMVVDGGERSEYFDCGEQVLLPFLRYMGVRRVDVVVASHPHNDHIGGLVTLLEQMEVGHFLDSGQVYGSWTARRLRGLIAERGVRYHRVAAGDSLAGLGGVAVLVLHPTADFVDADGNAPFGLNNGSVAFSLQHGAVRVLFTGDVEQETDPAILAWGPRLQARLLKVAHHGSRTLVAAAFCRSSLARSGGDVAGEGNKFKHPAPEVVARYTAHGGRVLRTDHTGAVRVRIDGAGHGRANDDGVRDAPSLAAPIQAAQSRSAACSYSAIRSRMARSMSFHWAQPRPLRAHCTAWGRVRR